VPGFGDNSQFTVAGSKLYFNGIADYESLSSYSILVRVTDAGGLCFVRCFTIYVKNVNEAPLTLALTNADALGRLAVNENVPAGTALGNLSGTDPDFGDAFHFALVPGYRDNDKVAIQGNALTLSASPDYETRRVYDIQIAAIDRAGLRLVRTFAIDVRDLNEAPFGLTIVGIGSSASNQSPRSLLLPDTTPPRTAIATLGAQDPDTGDFVAFRLLDDAGGRFVIVGNQLMIAPGVNLNRESASEFTVTFAGFDRGNLFTIGTVDIVLTRSDVRSFESALFDQGLFNAKPVNRLPTLTGSGAGTETTTESIGADDSADAAAEYVFVIASVDPPNDEPAGIDSRLAYSDLWLSDTRTVLGDLPWSSRVLDRIAPTGNDVTWISEEGLGATNQSLAVPLSGVSNLLESGDGVRYFSEALRNHAHAEIDAYIEPIRHDPPPASTDDDPPAPAGNAEEESLAWTATLKQAICYIAAPIAASAVVLCGWFGTRKKRHEPMLKKPTAK
jgi:hypothetical protein